MSTIKLPYVRHHLSAEKEGLVRLLSKPSDAQGMYAAVSVVAVYAGSALLILWSSLWFLQILGIIGMSCAMIRGGFLVHEASHHTLMKTRKWNAVFGVAFGIPIAMPVTIYGYFHRIHHAYERTERDPGNLEFMAQKLHIHPTLLQWLVLIVGTELSILQTVLTALVMVVRSKRRDILVEYLLVALFFFSVFSFITLTEFMVVWVLPFLLAATAMNVRIIAEHELPVSLESQFTRTRTVVSNRLIQWILYNGNFHLEHHLYPKVPAYNLPRLHRLLQEEFRTANSSIYSGYGAFMRDYMMMSWQRLRTPTITP
ncbi:MAG: fatty acid desaturase [Armatimonadetes bacterium]|nr:fatty acid desaturase [Armatimonadota bacterium]